MKAAVRWLKHHAADLGIDPTRTSAWGASAGGYLTSMLAVTAHEPELDPTVGIADEDNTIRAGVSCYGPTNLATQPRLGPPALHNTDPAQSPEAKLLGAAVETVPELAARASPVTYAAADPAPLLLVHGTLDDGVLFSQSEELVAAYQRAGSPIELIRVPDPGHGFGEIDSDLLAASAGFLLQHLTVG